MSQSSTSEWEVRIDDDTANQIMQAALEDTEWATSGLGAAAASMTDERSDRLSSGDKDPFGLPTDGGAHANRGGVPNGFPELRELRYFVAAAEELHFTRASRRLHIAQQALSSAIRRLETRLGTALFERTTRRVRLTAAGEALLPKARQALLAAEHAVAAARDAGRGVTGHLSVGVSRSAHRFGSPVLRALRQRAPGIELRVRNDFSQPLAEALTAEGLDAAFLFCPEERPDLAYLRLADEQALAVMHPDHRLAHLATLRVTDLARETLSLAPPAIGHGYNTAVMQLCEREGVTPRTVESPGYLGPAGLAPHETLGVTTATALDGIPTDFELVRIPLQNCTLPFDLVWDRERDSAPVQTLRSITSGIAAIAGWHCAGD